MAVLDLRASDVFVEDPNIRAAFSASVSMLEPDGPDLLEGACRNVVVTLDVFDNVTGRSNLFLAHTGFIDDPDLIDDPNIIPGRRVTLKQISLHQWAARRCACPSLTFGKGHGGNSSTSWLAQHFAGNVHAELLSWRFNDAQPPGRPVCCSS